MLSEPATSLFAPATAASGTPSQTPEAGGHPGGSSRSLREWYEEMDRTQRAAAELRQALADGEVDAGTAG